MSLQGLSLRARQLYEHRRRREKLLPAGLFGEPAWDILLDLFIAYHQGQQVAVTSACIAAATPPTTALRWIATLERTGLIERTPDPTDRRRKFLRLTKLAVDQLTLLIGRP